MTRYAYFDVLDTDRTAFQREDQAIESIAVGQAELTLALLRGWTPVFPQTYGWDSLALLGFAEGTTESQFFRQLVREGHIQFRMRTSSNRTQSNLVEAAIADFESAKPLMSGAWPELNGDRPIVECKEVVGLLRGRKITSAIPDGLAERVRQLIALSRAASEAPAAPSELPRKHRLSDGIRAAADAAADQYPVVAGYLRQVLNVDDPDRRRDIDAYLTSVSDRGEPVPEAVRSITNRVFNRVSAQCVGASVIGLTTPLSEPETVAVLC